MMTIDPEANVSELLESWTNGNRKDVLAALENDHPGLTAMFLTVGITDRILNKSDCNTITNLLMDRRRSIATT